MQGKKILICPLDWGLGHAARCVQVIRALQNAGAEVVAAADRKPYAMLRQEFPDLQLIRLPGYDISYPAEAGHMALEIAMQSPRLMWSIYREHRDLARLIKRHKIDLVISDNRFGLWTKAVPCNYITHQVMVKFPPWLGYLEPLFYKLHRKWIQRYNECWIPDFAGDPNLSGDLTHKYPPPSNAVYIGPLSRFVDYHPAETLSKDEDEFNCDILMILSGPEPQRSLFEEILIEQTKHIDDRKILILQGKTDDAVDLRLSDNVRLVSHLTSEKFNRALQSADLIISRSGYCTILDLAVLGKRAIFVPTPGQTEQEYLARKMMHEDKYYCVPQSDFDLKSALAKVKGYKGVHFKTDAGNLIVRRVGQLLK